MGSRLFPLDRVEIEAPEAGQWFARLRDSNVMTALASPSARGLESESFHMGQSPNSMTCTLCAFNRRAISAFLRILSQRTSLGSYKSCCQITEKQIVWTTAI